MLEHMYLQIGILNSILILIVATRVYKERNQFRDCKLFSRLLLCTFFVDVLDTTGWLLDGRLTGGLKNITNIVDGLNLIATAGVCWCWVQYVQFLSYDDAGMSGRKNYFSTILFAIHTVAIAVTIPNQLFYYIDEEGKYCRSTGYSLTLIFCLIQLIYSISICLITRRKVKSKSKRKELFLIGHIILLPIAGTIFQAFYYGYQLIWTCMTVILVIVYIHIQDKRRERENQEQQEKLQLALEQAQAASKAKTDFLSNMSHDIRTPMNAIIGFTTIAKDNVNNQELVEDSLQKINTSSQYLMNLINDVLDMNYIESGRMQLQMAPCNLLTLLQDLEAMVAGQIEEKKLHLLLDTTAVKNEGILADAMKLNQVFANLIGNAIKFNRPGGQVFIGVSQTSTSHAGNSSEGNSSATIGHYIFTVKDTGCGIAREKQQHIFEPFERDVREDKKDSVEGTGLGLTIVQKIVEMMGGTISVISEVGIGTEFIIELDFFLQDVPKAVKKDRPIKDFHGKRVLVAEDHPLNRDIIVRVLSNKGFTVEIAEDGKIAVDKFEDAAPNHYDLILMDIRMPNMDGYQATEAIRKLQREDAKIVPIVALTANAFEEDKRQALEHGMNAHLSKPLDVQELFETLGQLI